MATKLLPLCSWSDDDTRLKQRVLQEVSKFRASLVLKITASLSSSPRLRLRPKCLQDVSKMDISTRIFGCDLNMPIGISPTALQKFAHPEGELANARAAEKAGVVFTMSSFTNTSFKEISDACPKLIKWYQLYIYEDREMTEKMVKTAEATGFKAIVLTVDSPAYGISYAMKRDHPPFRKPKDFW